MDHKYLLRHMLATMAFRVRTVVNDAPEGFADFEAGMDTRTPTQILNHINGMLSITEEWYRGETPTAVEEVPWIEAIEVFHGNLAKLDRTVDECDVDERLFLQMFQGPWCDAMTHVGKLGTLRRLFGSPIKVEPYMKADIQVGKVGPRQPVSV